MPEKKPESMLTEKNEQICREDLLAVFLAAGRLCRYIGFALFMGAIIRRSMTSLEGGLMMAAFAIALLAGLLGRWKKSDHSPLP